MISNAWINTAPPLYATDFHSAPGIMTSSELKQGDAELSVVPGLGGAIANLSVNGRDVLRACQNLSKAGPIDMASIILTPFSNRISSGAFTWNETIFEIPKTLNGEKLPIHGDGFLKSWDVTNQSENSVALTLECGSIGPFAYSAFQRFDLTPSSLRVGLEITNKGDRSLPFGFGFHPWFPKTAETRLQFEAEGYWENNDQNCSDVFHKTLENHKYNFDKSRHLPKTLINNGFTGWKGSASISQGDGFVTTTLTASTNLSTAIIYCPGSNANFFCFEPVSHPIDAFNLPGYPGLTVLAPGQTETAWMQLDW